MSPSSRYHSPNRTSTSLSHSVLSYLDPPPRPDSQLLRVPGAPGSWLDIEDELRFSLDHAPSGVIMSTRNRTFTSMSRDLPDSPVSPFRPAKTPDAIELIWSHLSGEKVAPCLRKAHEEDFEGRISPPLSDISNHFSGLQYMRIPFLVFILEAHEYQYRCRHCAIPVAFATTSLDPQSVANL
ncbi:uncharacterized protein BT62DRAFT_1004095 [Guyanagaster necrorhizus]|uniref:Uncharacterized protein n=1 Tax=Guyanagaster necrorhizus TaxID=856835 RepID=A0A9P7VY15_9AGAR|nr:uncharacterized protein BT62DRAFT_1004095 [Guyanagaster necrorhizus MCA 3950]KAG7448304.1 hypothetical protein BT62DRAFT_1004095 [Guyanagaster necrorhizus MCA 3950]